MLRGPNVNQAVTISVDCVEQVHKWYNRDSVNNDYIPEYTLGTYWPRRVDEFSVRTRSKKGVGLPEDAATYFELPGAKGFLDIDPLFDSDWIVWATLRVYVFMPTLLAMIGDMLPLNYARLVSVANNRCEDLHAAHDYFGFVKKENLTVEQLKFATGIARTPQGRLRPLRFDKAMLVLYAINAERERRGLRPIAPVLILSAFSIRGVGATFAALDRNQKEMAKAKLAAALGQSEIFADELLKGCKVSIDSAIAAFRLLLTMVEFKAIPRDLSSAIETPTTRHTSAAQFEDFSVGRLPTLPSPFKRPKRAKS